MMKNFGDMMKQAASLQGKMEEMQQKIAAMEAEGAAGGRHGQGRAERQGLCQQGQYRERSTEPGRRRCAGRPYRCCDQ